ncbi:hypothetical protein C8J57DRAFT_1295831 [Mycena rebaudengoi]|nr:hypothetical protein C8J57DRAFT_1295831 [Mycena rebaudengoi]
MSSTNTTKLMTPAFPPAAHTSSSTRAGELITEQPAPASGMSLVRGKPEEERKTGPAARLRGGCIPCPDGGCCYIIPIPCCC